MARLARRLANLGRTPESRTVGESPKLAPQPRDLRLAIVEQLVFEQKLGGRSAVPAMDNWSPTIPTRCADRGKLILRDAINQKLNGKRQRWQFGCLLERRDKDPVVVAQVADLVRSANQSEKAVELYESDRSLARRRRIASISAYYHTRRTADALATWRPMAEGSIAALISRGWRKCWSVSAIAMKSGYARGCVGLDNDFAARIKHADLLQRGPTRCRPQSRDGR